MRKAILILCLSVLLLAFSAPALGEAFIFDGAGVDAPHDDFGKDGFDGAGMDAPQEDLDRDPSESKPTASPKPKATSTPAPGATATPLAPATQEMLDTPPEEDMSGAPGSSRANPILVNYFLTESEMGTAEAEVTSFLKGIINDYHLTNGTYHLQSNLDMCYPDERATLVVENGMATISGPYFSDEYAIVFP